MRSVERMHVHLDFEREALETFLQRQGLRYEPSDVCYVLREDGRIVGCGCYSGNLIKMLAVEESQRSTGALQQILTALKDDLASRGLHRATLFTKPMYATVFRSLGFSEIAATEDAVMMSEDADGLSAFCARLRIDGPFDGAVVMNANPFTLGHRALVEYAVAHSSRVAVFVVEEDVSRFPFSDRIEMVRRGTEDLDVCVLPGGDWIISQKTFPTYFLKESSDRSTVYARMDAAVFFEHVAPAMTMRCRFVGAEPFDAATKTYNRVLKEEALRRGFTLTEIPRLENKDGPIGASNVRAMIDRGETDFSCVLPRTSIAYLREREYIPWKSK